MKIISTEIEDVFIIETKIFEDSRGFFTEKFRTDLWQKAGHSEPFIQDNHSRSKPGVLRGLHFQTGPTQGKLVTCIRGEVFDVAVDLRSSSKSYGQHISIVLNANIPKWFWIPPGFAHGFCVLGNEPADVLYKVDGAYSPTGDGGLLWNDPDLRISWPIEKPILSDKDLKLPNFKEYKAKPVFA